MATEIEKMIIAASRLLQKDAAIYVGTGMPLLASVLALKPMHLIFTCLRRWRCRWQTDRPITDSSK